MKQSVTLITMMVLTIVCLAAGQVRPPLTYFYSTATDGYPTAAVKNPAWGQDTSVLRAVLDSNSYSGSCLPFITTITGNNPAPLQVLNAVQGVYRISRITFSSQSWLTKITSNIGNLLYLTELGISGCHNLSSIGGINQYLQDLEIDSSAINNLNFNTAYLKGLAMKHCKNLTVFSYTMLGSKGFSLTSNAISDISGLTIGDSCKSIYIDSNQLSTLPANLLQQLAANGGKINIDYNYLANVPSNIATLLDQISMDPNWRATQKPSTSVKTAFIASTVARVAKQEKFYSPLGKLLPEVLHTKGVYISNVTGEHLFIK